MEIATKLVAKDLDEVQNLIRNDFLTKEEFR
jgi:hypothetical protein